MRNEGVLTLKQGGIEINLSQQALLSKVATQEKDMSDSIETDHQYTDEDLIEWSNITAGIGMDNQQ